MTPNWTWKDLPKGAWHKPKTKTWLKPSELASRTAKSDVDPIAVALVNSMSKKDLEFIVESRAACRKTLDNWSTGRTKAPRISTLHRVAAALGKHIELVDD